MRLVIAGAQYFDGDSILIPHYTGEYWMVDCDEYVPLKELKNKGYSPSYIKDAKRGYFIEHEGVKYYSAEYGPFNVSDDWELLSDLSNLRFEE